MKPKIFGFGHRSRVGKDTASGFLAGHIRQSTRNKLVVKTSFAAKMKAMTYDLYKWAGLQPADYYETEQGAPYRDIKLEAIGKTPVEIWIEFGSTVGRAIFKDTWVNYPLNQKYDYLIISDVRFLNEVEGIRKLGGVVYKIEKADAPIRNSVADNELQDYTGWDGVLKNNGDLKEFGALVIDTFKGWL